MLVATRSTGKMREIKKLLGHLDCEILFPDDVGIPYRETEESIEDTDSYRGNALAKARYFATLSGLPSVADDSGIEVDALQGRPGVNSRRYADPSRCQDEANNSKMLDELKGVPRKDRTARYRCVVAFLTGPKAEPRMFEGMCEGFILDAADGDGGFGYDPIFFSTDLNTSFGCVSQQAKDEISHRGRAFRKFLEWLENSGEPPT